MHLVLTERRTRSLFGSYTPVQLLDLYFSTALEQQNKLQGLVWH